MDKFLPFLYEKKNSNKFVQEELYLNVYDYPLKNKENEEKDEENYIVIEIL